MGVTSVVRYGQPTLAPNDEGHRVYTVEFRVTTNSKDDGPKSVLVGGRAFATPLPAAGAVYSFGNDIDLYATADPIPAVDLVDEKALLRYWKVTYTYTTVPRKRCQTAEIEDPTAEPWEVDGDSDEWTEEARAARDSAGTSVVPVESSSHEPFTGKAVEVFKTRRRLTLTKNYSAISTAWVDAYEGTVNSATITICGQTYAPRTVRIRKIRWTRRRWGTCTYYYPTTFNLDINLNTHDLQPWDMGRKHYVGPVGAGEDREDRENFATIREEPAGDLTTEPYFLDGNGNILGASATPVSSRFRHYDEANFSVFGFPAA